MGLIYVPINCVGGSTASHALTLGATESLYKHSLVEPCYVSDLAEILQSFFLLPHLLPIVAPECRQRPELGRGTEFSLSHVFVL